MLAAGRTSAPGVVVHRVLCGPFSQNLHWDPDSGRLTLVQNVIAGRGWRLDVVDLALAVRDGRGDGPGVRVGRMTFPSHEELEGYWPQGGGRSLFAVARRRDNLLVGAIREHEPYLSPPAEGRDNSATTPAVGKPPRDP